MQNKQQQKSISTNPKSIILMGLIVILLFFGGLGAWASIFPISGAVMAPGKIKVSQERKTVSHLEGGIVDKILVRDGEKVQQGDVLIKLRNKQATAQVDMIQGQIMINLAKAARLRAQKDEMEKIVWPPALLMQASKEKEQDDKVQVVQEAMQKEQDIFQSSRNSLQKRVSTLQNQIEQLQENIQGAQEEMQAQEEIISVVQEELQAKEELLKEEYLDKSEILSLRRSLAEHKGRRGSLRQKIAESRQKIQEKMLSIESQRSEYREEAASELSQVNDRLFELRQQLIPSLDKSERLKVRAPISGEVVNMQVHSEDGGVIKAGSPILDIVPQDAKLVVECRIREDQITKVSRGQKTRVQLSAFNRVTTPQVEGELVWISADRIEEDTRSGTQTYFKGHVHVDQESLQQADAYLSPGMPATAFITTEERTFLTYILEPILLNMDRALRERM